MDDVFRLIKSGVIRPGYSRDGDVQTVDFFAETGLSLRERKKVFMRTFPDPAGIRMYVHRGCAEAYRRRVANEGQVIFEPGTEEWTPQDLIGRFRDVTHCDACAQPFAAADEGYLAYWVITADEYEVWQEVQRERQPGGSASGDSESAGRGPS
jgi:hypothetical protein